MSSQRTISDAARERKLRLIQQLSPAHPSVASRRRGHDSAAISALSSARGTGTPTWAHKGRSVVSGAYEAGREGQALWREDGDGVFRAAVRQREQDRRRMTPRRAEALRQWGAMGDFSVGTAAAGTGVDSPSLPAKGPPPAVSALERASRSPPPQTAHVEAPKWDVGRALANGGGRHHEHAGESLPRRWTSPVGAAQEEGGGRAPTRQLSSSPPLWDVGRKTPPPQEEEFLGSHAGEDEPGCQPASKSPAWRHASMSSPLPEAPPGGARASASPPTLLAGSASPSPGGEPRQQAESTPQHGGGVLLSADLGKGRASTFENQQQQHHNHLTPLRGWAGRGSEGLGAIAHQQQRKTPHGNAAASIRSPRTPFGFTPSRTPGRRYGMQLGASASSPANHPMGPSSEASAHRFLKTPGGAVRDFGGSYKTPGSSGKFPRHELSAMGSLAISARVQLNLGLTLPKSLAAVLIQAMWRGHAVRRTLPMLIAFAHRICAIVDAQGQGKGAPARPLPGTRRGKFWALHAQREHKAAVKSSWSARSVPYSIPAALQTSRPYSSCGVETGFSVCFVNGLIAFHMTVAGGAAPLDRKAEVAVARLDAIVGERQNEMILLIQARVRGWLTRRKVLRPLVDSPMWSVAAVCEALRKGRAAVKIYNGVMHSANRATVHELVRMARSEVTFLSELDLVRSDFLDELKHAIEPGRVWGNGLASAISPRDVASICGGIYLIRERSLRLLYALRETLGRLPRLDLTPVTRCFQDLLSPLSQHACNFPSSLATISQCRSRHAFGAWLDRVEGDASVPLAASLYAPCERLDDMIDLLSALRDSIPAKRRVKGGQSVAECLKECLVTVGHVRGAKRDCMEVMKLARLSERFEGGGGAVDIVRPHRRIVRCATFATLRSNEYYIDPKAVGGGGGLVFFLFNDCLITASIATTVKEDGTLTPLRKSKGGFAGDWGVTSMGIEADFAVNDNNLGGLAASVQASSSPLTAAASLHLGSSASLHLGSSPLGSSSATTGSLARGMVSASKSTRIRLDASMDKIDERVMYRMQTAIPLLGSTVTDEPDVADKGISHAIRILDVTGQSVVMCAKSLEDKKSWLADMAKLSGTLEEQLELPYAAAV